jgi:hypothetical protein
MLAGGCTLDFVEFVYPRLDLKYSLVMHLNVTDYFKNGPPSVLSMLETTNISERFGVLDLDYRRLLQDG